MRTFRVLRGLTITTVAVGAIVTGALAIPAPAPARAPAADPNGVLIDALGGALGDGRWQRLVTTGPAPSGRSAPTAVGIGSNMYVFGGARDDFATGTATFSNDLHRFDLATRRWTTLTPAGPVPPARAFAAGSAQPASRRLFVFGGSTFDVPGTTFSPYDDLWAYSAGTNRWSRLTSSTPGPSARSGAALWTVGDQLYLFGGIDATFTTLNELWRYDLARARWSPVAYDGPAPPGRHVAQTGEAAAGRLTLYGGESIDPQVGFVALGDTWEFDLAAHRWRDVTPAPAADITPPRNYGAAAVVGTALYLQGGDVPGGTGGCGAPFPQNPTNEVWRFDLVHHTWRQLAPGGDPVPRLKRHAAATVAGRMLVVAGWDFQCPDGTGPGQVWNTDVYALAP